MTVRGASAHRHALRTAVAVAAASILVLSGCASSGDQSGNQSGGAPSGAPTSSPTYPPGAGDVGIGTHICSGGDAALAPRTADRLDRSRRFDTVYLDAAVDSTPDVPTLRSWIDQGISPVIDLTLKNGPFTLAQVAQDRPPARAYLDTFVAGLGRLAARAKSRHNRTRVYFSFEHETVAKINQGKFVYPGYGGRQPTIEDAAAAWNRVQGLVAKRAPGVVRLLWFGGSTPGEDDYAALLDAHLIQMATFDPYRWRYNAPDADAAQLWGARIDHLLAQTWMREPGGGVKPWGLTEWGTDRSLGDASNARFVADTLAYLNARGARFAVYFDCSDGPDDFRFTDGSSPRTLAAYLTTVA